MILIADSGATKTDWIILSDNEQDNIKTQGINPFHQTKEQIRLIITNELTARLGRHSVEDIDEIYFYGAGCLPGPSTIIEDILQDTFAYASVNIHTDLTGAARALCQNKPGIACIIGTGSNSCQYDGKEITSNIPPLGFILGDEGSGAYIGKRFVADCMKGLLPHYLKDGLLEDYHLTEKDILYKVYKEPQANRFLASMTHYIYKHKDEAEVKAFLKNCFKEFFRRNLAGYDKCLKVSFTGSVAWFFREEIKETAKEMGYATGSFAQSPINGLAEYHKNRTNH